VFPFVGRSPECFSLPLEFLNLERTLTVSYRAVFGFPVFGPRDFRGPDLPHLMAAFFFGFMRSRWGSLLESFLLFFCPSLRNDLPP